MKVLAEALKPVLKEVIHEEFSDKIKDFEVRVDKADETIASLKQLDPRVLKIENEVEELKKRVADMEAFMRSGGAPSSAGQAARSQRFAPTYVEIKGFCSWDERREKGLTRAQALQFHKNEGGPSHRTQRSVWGSCHDRNVQLQVAHQDCEGAHA